MHDFAENIKKTKFIKNKKIETKKSFFLRIFEKTLVKWS